MTYQLFLSFTILSTLILSVITYRNAFVNGKPHCNNFVTNVYLYLALSFALIGSFVHVYNFIFNPSSQRGKHIDEYIAYSQIMPYIFVSFVISIVSIIILSMGDMFTKDGILVNHTLWLVFVGSIALTLYPIFKSKQLATIVPRALLMTIGIFLLMSFFVYAFPTFFESTYKRMTTGLLIALLIIIMAELYLIASDSYTQRQYKIISYILISLFSLYVSYDTSRILNYAKKCIDSPNYPKISTSLLIDIVNIFVRLVGVSRDR